MGIGSCILGYGDSEIDAAVLNAIAAGNMSSLNCIEELELAEELIKINPKMDMVRFARTGGEACMIAARIAKMSNRSRGREPGELYLQHGYSGWALGNPERSYGLSFNNSETLELMNGVIDEISWSQYATIPRNRRNS
jgi:glutamate-1-semialdehyde 2,1-aminomutase